jgi:hypothetical protein
MLFLNKRKSLAYNPESLPGKSSALPKSLNPYTI